MREVRRGKEGEVWREGGREGKERPQRRKEGGKEGEEKRRQEAGGEERNEEGKGAITRDSAYFNTTTYYSTYDPQLTTSL